MDQNQVASFFDRYVTIGSSTTGIPYESIVFYVLCLALNTWILSKGLQGGVERVAKLAVPMLLLFGGLLAIRGLTLGASGAPADCTDCNAFAGLDYFWRIDGLTIQSPKVWLAAAGQIFFTTSVGFGTIHCYASFVKKNNDVALNAMSAGWMNGFVEVVLGASIVIPIAIGYLGFDWVMENAGFNMAFQTMPYLFGQWGQFLGTIAGLMWFGLLFFAGITSSLAFGTPVLSFLTDEFGYNNRKAALLFGLVTLIVGLPTVFFYQQGVFDEYDFWSGTVSLVVFALIESVLFAWVFGMRKGWNEITRGSDINIPRIYKPITQFVTPIMLIAIFLTALVTPKDNDWQAAFSGNWELDKGSIIGKLLNKDVTYNKSWFANEFESETAGQVVSITQNSFGKQVLNVGQPQNFYKVPGGTPKPYAKASIVPQGAQTFDSLVVVKTYAFSKSNQIKVAPGDDLQPGAIIATGSFTNRLFYTDMARLLLSLLFLAICFMVYKASRRQRKQAQA